MVESLMGILTVGEEWILYLLFLVSIICLGIMVERQMVYMKSKGKIDEIKAKLMSFLEERNYEGARKYFSNSNDTTSKILVAAFASLDRSPEALQEMIDAETTSQRSKLERGLDFLGSVGSNAPFVGLLGTVMGIIQAFQALGKSQTAEPQVVMAGISSALVATAVGLAVAIPALVAFNYFKGVVREILRSTDSLCKEILSYSLDHTLGRPSFKGKEGKSEKAEV